MPVQPRATRPTTTRTPDLRIVRDTLEVSTPPLPSLPARELGDVVVWRTRLLPTSETFIANQMGALTEWRPRLAGLERVASLLPVQPDLVLGRTEGAALRRLGTAPRLHRLLRAPATRLVHAHFGTDAMRVLPAACLARCPLVVTFHGYDITKALTSPTYARYAQRLPRLFAASSALIAVSEFIAERLVAAGAPEAKVVVHRIGTPLPPAPAAVRPARPVVLFVGRLVEKKNCAGLLDAVAALPEPLRGTAVRVVGDGPLRADLEQQARVLGLDVTFLGATDTHGVTRELRQATVFCSPGRPAVDGDAEGLGMVFLEAAALGLPVVAGDSGGTREAVLDGVTGRVTPAGDTAALARALAVVLQDRQLAERFGAAGRRHVQAHFDLTRQTAELERIYERAARQVGRRVLVRGRMTTTAARVSVVVPTHDRGSRVGGRAHPRPAGVAAGGLRERPAAEHLLDPADRRYLRATTAATARHSAPTRHARLLLGAQAALQWGPRHAAQRLLRLVAARLARTS